MPLPYNAMSQCVLYFLHLSQEEEISVKLAQCEDLVAVKRQLESEIEDCKRYVFILLNIVMG